MYKRISGAILLAAIRTIVSVAKHLPLRRNIEKPKIKKVKRDATESNYSIAEIAGKVAIIIPVYNGWKWTKLCLESVVKSPDFQIADVWVIDDASTDETAREISKHFPQVKVRRNRTNLGFLRSCNEAFEKLSHEYTWLFLLNNDTEVLPGFLFESLSLAQLQPKAGLIGSKLIFPDGTLQEAGGLFWRAGNAWNFGRGGDPQEQIFNIDRKVDYSSGAALLLRSDAIRGVQFFSEEFLPAYCEDSDLAFKLRKAGFETWYAHKSQIIHYEGKSHGTSESEGIKSHQVINSQKLAAKWVNELQNHLDENPMSVLEAAFRQSPERLPDFENENVKLLNFTFRLPKFARKFAKRALNFYLKNSEVSLKSLLWPSASFLGAKTKAMREIFNPQVGKDLSSILIVEQQIPTPDTNAGDQTTYLYIEAMRNLGKEVTLYTAIKSEGKNPDLEQLGVNVHHDPDGFLHWFQKHGVEFGFIWLARPHLALPILQSIRKMTTAKLAYYTHDLHFLRLFRQAWSVKNPVALVQGIKTYFVEKSIFEKADLVLSPNSEETEKIRRISNAREVDTIAPFFYEPKSIGRRTKESFVGVNNIVFLGGYSHSPNVDAAIFLAEKIMPIVWDEMPQITLTLAGANPTKEVLRLANARVTVAGKIESIEALYSKSLLLVAPLRYGAGIKGKTVEAMKLGLPVVGSKITFEGLGVKNLITGCIAESPKEFADAIVLAFRDPELCSTISSNAAETIREKFTKDKAYLKLSSILLASQASETSQA